MPPDPSEQQLARLFFLCLAEGAAALQAGAQDREVALHALIEAAGLLKERLEQELDELRREEG